MIAGGCVSAGCGYCLLDDCWLLILLAGWLLVAAAGRWMDACCGWDTACWMIADCCYWLLDDCWLRLGYCWFAAKRILRAKKSLKISGIMMIFGWIDGFEGILLSLSKLGLRKFLVKIHLGRVTLGEEKNSVYQQPSARPERGSFWC